VAPAQARANGRHRRPLERRPRTEPWARHDRALGKPAARLSIHGEAAISRASAADRVSSAPCSQPLLLLQAGRLSSVRAGSGPGIVRGSDRERPVLAVCGPIAPQQSRCAHLTAAPGPGSTRESGKQSPGEPGKATRPKAATWINAALPTTISMDFHMLKLLVFAAEHPAVSEDADRGCG